MAKAKNDIHTIIHIITSPARRSFRFASELPNERRREFSLWVLILASAMFTKKVPSHLKGPGSHIVPGSQAILIYSFPLFRFSSSDL
jgi:hypothetical protein